MKNLLPHITVESCICDADLYALLPRREAKDEFFAVLNTFNTARLIASTPNDRILVHQVVSKSGGSC